MYDAAAAAPATDQATAAMVKGEVVHQVMLSPQLPEGKQCKVWSHDHIQEAVQVQPCKCSVRNSVTGQSNLVDTHRWILQHSLHSQVCIVMAC
jgi:hypothetical protein